MKILQINSVCGIGSTGRIATDIHRILLDRGHESYIAYGRDLPKDCSHTIKIGRSFDNYAHLAKTRIFDMHGFASKRATADFMDRVKELDPDIIHLHNIHGYYINIEILFDGIKELNKPVMWTLHDCWSFTGHCANFEYVACEKWKTGCYNCPQKTQYPASLILDNSRKNYLKKKRIFKGVKDLTIFTPSKWLAGLVKESFLSEYKIQTIYNGIDLSIFRPTESKFREKYNLEDKYIILGVSNVWNNRKGLDDFIQLSRELKESEIIVLVGVTEKQKIKLPKNILGISKTNNAKELAEIYSAANVFVNLTKEDNYPTVNLESVACGTPVISYDTGGCGEFIGEENGYILDKNKPAEVIRIINSIRVNESPLSTKSPNKRLDKDELFNDYIRYYERYK